MEKKHSLKELAGVFLKLQITAFDGPAAHIAMVSPTENKNKMETYLTKAGVIHKIITIKDCGHDMITQDMMNGAEETWSYTYWQWQKQPEEFVNSIFEFIKK